MSNINSQTKMLRTGYVYLGIFLISVLFGVFFSLSGAIDDAATGTLVKGFEPVNQNMFTGFFFDYSNISLFFRILMLAGISVFILNITGIRKFLPGLILTVLISANPYLIGIFKVQSAFAIIPALFFALLGIVLSINIKTRLKYISYISLLISALFMPQIAIASAFMILMYQLLPVSLTSETNLPKQPKKLSLIVFFAFFVLLVVELIVLSDSLNFKLIADKGLFAPGSNAGNGSLYFFFPFIQRLNSLSFGTSGVIYLFIFLVLSLFLLVLSTKPLVSKKGKLKNIRQNLTALYWSMGLLIFLLIAAFMTELSPFVNTAGLFVGIAVIICVYSLISRMKFKQNMVVGLVGSAFAIILALTTLLTQQAWENKDSLMRNLAESSEYSRYAKAQLAEFAYKKALETNNPQKFDEYYKNFKDLYDQYMQNPYVQAPENPENQPVNTSKFAELDILIDFHETLRLWDAYNRFAGINLPDADLKASTMKMLKLEELFGKQNTLEKSINNKIINQKKYGLQINFEYYKTLASMLPNNSSTLNLSLFEPNREYSDASFSNCEFYPNFTKGELEFLSLYPANEKLTELEYNVYSRFVRVLEHYSSEKSKTFSKFIETVSSMKTNVIDFEILETLVIADLLISENESITSKYDAEEISIKLLNLAAKDTSPYLQMEIMLRRGLIYQFLEKLNEEAIRIYDSMIELNKIQEYTNAHLISHVMYLKARILHEKGFTKDALVLLDNAILQDKNNHSAQVLRGKIRFDASKQRLEELIVSFTKEYRALPEDKQNAVVERSKYIPIWELERAFFEESETYRTLIQNIENNLAAAYEIDKENNQLKQTYSDLLFYRGYGQRALKNTDLAELALRRSYNINPKSTTNILGAKISDVLGQFYFEVWSAYLIGDSITEENQADVNDLLARALQLSEFVRDQLYDFVQNFIKDHPDLKPDRLLPFYLTAKEIYPDWVPARRWLSEYYRILGELERWEEEFMALLRYTEDQEQWPELNLECSQNYLIWASYGLRKLQNITDPEELKKQASEVEKLFAKSDKYNDVFARFGDSEFLFWQNRSILYQRWADLLVSLGDEEAWLEKVNLAIDAFEHYLNLETIDANNAAIASLYRAKFLYLWRKNQAEWYKNNENWEKNAETSEMIECMSKYKDWITQPHEKTIASNEAKLIELNKDLEGYKKSGFAKKVNELVDKISDLNAKNKDLKEQLGKSKTVNGWLFNYITVLQGIDAFKEADYNDSLKLFTQSYDNVKGAYDAFWIARIYELMNNTELSIRWYLISASKYPHALIKISDILDESNKASNIDKMYLKTYLLLTEAIKNNDSIKRLRDEVTNKFKNNETIQKSEALKIHRAKLDAMLADMMIENSDSSVLSLILGELDAVDGDYVNSFKNYIRASMSSSLFNQVIYKAGKAIFKSDEYKFLSVYILSMLKDSLIFGDQSELNNKLLDDTSKLLSEVTQKINVESVNKQEINKALEFLKNASEGNKIPAYDYILGDLLVAQRDFNQAEDKYRNANTSEFLFFPANLALAEMYFQMDNMKPRAFLAYKEFINLLKQTGKESYIEKIPEKSRNHYNSILDEYNNLLKEGKKAYAEGEYELAIKSLENCFRFVRSGTTAFIIAGAYQKLSDPINAESWYLTTIQSPEIILHAYYDLAIMLENTPEKRWRAYWAINKLIELIEDSENPEVNELLVNSRNMLTRLNALKTKYFSEGEKFLENKEYDQAFNSFKLSYNINESPETAYLAGKSLLESWILSFNAETIDDLKKLKESENWFILAALADNGNPLGYFDLGSTYLKYLNQTSKTKEYYELFLNKTKASDNSDIKEKRKMAQSFLDTAVNEIKTSLDDGKKYFQDKKYNLAYNKFLLNFKSSNSSEAALWIARCLAKLRKLDLAQDWFLYSANDLPEAFYELADSWYNLSIKSIRWISIKYFETFIKIAKNVEKYESLYKDAESKLQAIQTEFAEFSNMPVTINISIIKEYVWVYYNLYETGMMFYKNHENWWLADIYLNAFIKLVTDIKFSVDEDNVKKYKENLETAQETRKIISQKYEEALTKAFDFKDKNENIQAIEQFEYVLDIKRSFPADYSMLLSLLETEKQFDKLILWSDRAVNFYTDAETGFKQKMYEMYFYVNAKAHFEYGDKKTGIERLKTYLEKWNDGKYAESVKILLESATQTKPN